MNVFIIFIKKILGFYYCKNCNKFYKKKSYIWTIENGIEYYNGICNCKHFIKESNENVRR